MALFGGFQERREKKALERYFTAASVDATEIEELKKASPQAAAILYDILKQTPDHDKKFRALLGLHTLGVTAEMIPTVLEAMRDEDDFVQESAAKVLIANRQYAATVVPVLVAVYTDNVPARPIVLHIFSEYGAEAQAAVPVLVDGLRRPTEALTVARCLAHIGVPNLPPIERAMVEVLSDHKDIDRLRAVGPGFASTLETFLLSCVPWRTLDAIPAWRRALEAYADIGGRPPEPLLRVLVELVQYSDWKLRGEVGAGFIEMSRAKVIAEKLVRPQAGPTPA